MKYIKFIKFIAALFLFSSVVFARPWQKYLTGETLSVKTHPIKYFELDNKVRVYYLQNTVLPKITFELFIEGGAGEENQKNAGITSIWGNSVVLSGSVKYPQKVLAENLELHGSNFSFSPSLERSSFSLDALSEYFEQDLAMFVDVLATPALEKSDVDLIKSQHLQSIKKRKENPGQMAYSAAQLIQWKDNVRGMISTRGSIEPLEEKMLRAWHEKMLDTQRFSMLITGDIDPDKIKNLLNKSFSKFPTSKNKYKTDHLLVADGFLKKGDQVIYHQVKELPQTTIMMRAPGIKHSDKDYYAYKLYDFLLGGDSFNSYLTQAIRVKNGWAYSVYSSYNAGAYTGSTSIFVQTQNKNVTQVIDEIEKVLKNSEPVITEEGLAAAQNSLKNSMVFMAETPEKLAELQLSLKWDNLPDDYLNRFLDEIQKVTVDDLRRISKKYYASENFFVSLVGPEGVIVIAKDAKKSDTGRKIIRYELPE